MLDELRGDGAAQFAGRVFPAGFVLVGAEDGVFELFAETLDELFLQCLVDGWRRRRLLGFPGQFAQLFLGLDDWLHRPVAGHDRFEDQVFGQLVGASLNHEDRVLGPVEGVGQALVGDPELRRMQLAHGRIDDQLAVQIAHLDRGNWLGERDAGQVQRGARTDDAQDGRIVLLVGRHDEVHHLHVIAVVLGKQRPNRSIGQAR